MGEVVDVYNTAADIIERFIRYERSLQRETSQFEHLTHNADLCPAVQRQLERIMDAFSGFIPLVYDTQGPRDDGVDVLARSEREGDSESTPDLIGFQIKSHKEFRQKDFFLKLKAQRDDACRKVRGLTHYYILLCTDEAANKDTIRNIEQEFRSARQTFVIEPSYVHYFLNLSQTRIEGFVTRALSSEDIVFRRALEMVQVSAQSAGVLAVHLAAHYMGHPATLQELQRSGELRTYYDIFLKAKRQAADLALELGRVGAGRGDEDDMVQEDTLEDLDFETLLARDLELLNTSLVDLAGTLVTCREADLLPVTALLVDARVRYDLAPKDIVPYALDALGLLEV